MKGSRILAGEIANEDRGGDELSAFRHLKLKTKKNVLKADVD